MIIMPDSDCTCQRVKCPATRGILRIGGFAEEPMPNYPVSHLRHQNGSSLQK